MKKFFNSRTITALMFAIGVVIFILATMQVVAARESSKKAWLGVQIQELTPSLRESLKLGGKTGLLITEVVEGSPADDANLRTEDVIIEFNGQPVELADAFTKLVRASEPGKEVKVVVMRDGVRKEIMVTLAARKTPKSYTHAWSGEPMRFFTSQVQLGVQAQELNADLAEYFGVKEDGGALLLKIFEETPAEKAGLKAGDVITKIDDESIADPEDLMRTMADYEDGDDITITYVRHGQTATAKATLEEGAGAGFHFFQGPDKFFQGPDKIRTRIRSFDDAKIEALRNAYDAKRRALDAVRLRKLPPLQLKILGSETI